MKRCDEEFIEVLYQLLSERLRLDREIRKTLCRAQFILPHCRYLRIVQALELFIAINPKAASRPSRRQ